MDRTLDVICVGAAIVDIPLQPVSKNIFDIESYPVERIAMTIGGDAINEATIISRLGHKVALMGLVGKDAPGNFILDFCKKNEIDTESVCKDEAIDTSINVGLVTADGERTFVTNRNGSLWKMNIEHVDLNRFASAKLLSLASIFNNPLLDGDSLVKIFKQAKANGLIICADMIKARLGETLEDIKEALSYVDYFFPNYSEACLLTGKSGLEEITDTFLALGVKTVIIKTGKQGCYIKNADGAITIPAFLVKPKDTIGAGDNFVAGFIAALLEEKTLQECGVFANMTACISVQHLGATAGVQSRKQVEDALAKIS